MIRNALILSMLSSAALFANDDIDELKKQIAQLQQHLNTIEQTQKVNAQKELNDRIATATKSSSSFNQSAFLPDMSFILDASAVSRNIKNSEYKAYNMPGFTETPPVGAETEIPFNKDRGFNFNYAEVALHSVVDPYFDANVILHIREDGLEVEEAFVTTRGLPYGLRAKVGKFRSNFGRINAMHQHAWNFTSQPLVYEALIGGEGINSSGVQLQWIAPTDTYLMVGAEAMQKLTPESPNEENNLYIGYVKSSIDIGDTSILGGVSLAHSKYFEDEAIGLVNDSDIYGAELTIKSIFDSYSSLTLQSELLSRTQKTAGGSTTQAGMHSELVYKINSNYSTGVRYDWLNKNLDNQPDDLERYTAMVEYKPFEFSKIRLQFTHDKSKEFSGEQKDINEVLLGITIEAGAHGAHAF
ncbi:MAG: hypothetical protein L3J19_02120 [Sulfurimonas sp.]|nr:hypothetical protein [Sulfurimonas sp.]